MGNYNQTSFNEDKYNNMEYENVNIYPTVEGYYTFKWNNYNVKAYYDGVNIIDGQISNDDNKLLFTGVIKNMIPFSGTAYNMFYNGYTFDGKFNEYKFTGHLQYDDLKWEEGTFDEHYNLLTGNIYDNGTLYCGQFKNGQLDDNTGRKIYPNNDEQYGKFVKGYFVDGVYSSNNYKYDGKWLLDIFVEGSIYKNGKLVYEGMCHNNFEPYNGTAYDYEYNNYNILDDNTYMFNGKFENGYFNGQVLCTTEDNNFIQTGEFIKTNNKFMLINGTSIDTLHNLVYQGKWIYVNDDETFDGKVYKYIKENKTIDEKDNDYIYSGQIVNSKYFNGECDGVIIDNKTYYGFCKDYIFNGAVYNVNTNYKVYYGTIYFNDTSGSFNMIDGLAFKYVNGQYTYNGTIKDKTFEGVIRHNDNIMIGEFYEKSNILRKGTITYPDGTEIEGEWNKESFLHSEKVIITDGQNNQTVCKYNNGEKYDTFDKDKEFGPLEEKHYTSETSEFMEPIDEDKELELEFGPLEEKCYTSEFTEQIDEDKELGLVFDGPFDDSGFVEGFVKANTFEDLQDSKYFNRFKYIKYSYNDNKPFQGYYTRSEFSDKLVLKQIVLPNDYVLNCTCSLYILNSLHKIYNKNHLLDYSNINNIIIPALSLVELLMLLIDVIPNISTSCVNNILDNNFDGGVLTNERMYNFTMKEMGFTHLQLIKLDSLGIWKFM